LVTQVPHERPTYMNPKSFIDNTIMAEKPYYSAKE
jgi:hypothetical protein